VSRAVHPKDSGETVEAELIQRVPELQAAPGETAPHDAHASGVITPTPELPLGSTPLVETGTPVEIKAAQVRLTSGERGRWYLRREQHRKLLEAGGAYALVIYDPRPGHPIRASLLVPASIVDELVSSWIKPDGRADYAQIAWSNAIDPEEVDS